MASCVFHLPFIGTAIPWADLYILHPRFLSFNGSHDVLPCVTHLINFFITSIPHAYQVKTGKSLRRTLHELSTTIWRKDAKRKEIVTYKEDGIEPLHDVDLLPRHLAYCLLEAIPEEFTVVE